MADKPQGVQSSERTVIGILIILFMMQTYEWFMEWIKVPRHQYLAAGMIAMIALPLGIFLWKMVINVRDKNRFEYSVTAKDGDSVFCGMDDKMEEVWIKPTQRSMHTQVIGTTNAGKTESVILPWAIQDIHAGKGLLLIDGKADNALIDKLWAYTVLAKREKDFRLFSLSRREQSYQFNPLLGGTAEEITERVFNSFDFENPYYRSLQYEVMSQIMRIFEATKTTPTFQRLHQVISQPRILEELASKINDASLRQWVLFYLGLSPSDREMRTSGLLTAIGQFAFGANAELFNPEEEAITIDEALKNNQIIYFQLPVLLSPHLGKATGKLVLQSLQAAVANRHRMAQGNEKKFFSVFLDDFSEYLYEGFVSILNKSRSANVGIVFAHQALGDITALGDSVANSILTNANVKVFMRGNDPDSAEYFSKVIGTQTSTKYTERQKKGILGVDRSGDVSAREVEEFDVHPNEFKKSLGIGEAIMLIPHNRGVKKVWIKFNKLDDVPSIEIPIVSKSTLKLLNTKNESLKRDEMSRLDELPVNVLACQEVL